MGSLPSISDRVNVRLTRVEARRQENIEGICEKTAEELADESIGVSSAPVDKDWFVRFFDSCQDVSTPELQDVWARILAGEIRRPGSFGLQALDTLRKLSLREVLLFEELVAQSFTADFFDGDRSLYPFVMMLDRRHLSLRGIYYAGLEILENIGVVRIHVAQQSLAIPVDVCDLSFSSSDGEVKMKFTRNLGVVRSEDSMLMIGHIKFTEAGQELARLINIKCNIDWVFSDRSHLWFSQGGWGYPHRVALSDDKPAC